MRRFTGLMLAIGLALAVVWAFAVDVVLAARNSSGTYSLPSGNPVATGTAISSTVHNNTMSDFGTEITDSLSRSGKGGMSAPLQLADGTAALPGLTFGSDTDLGLYRSAANTMRAVCGSSTEVQRWTDSLSTFSKSVAITGTASTAALTTTATTSGVGIAATGAGNSAGGTFNGAGSGAGLTATGGGSGGPGATITGNGAFAGVVATGGSGTQGVTAANGTAATGGTRQDAIVATNGDINLASVANPTSTTAISERLTPMNLIKSWAIIGTDGAGNCIIGDGFNVTSCSAGASAIVVTMASAMSSSTFAVIANGIGTNAKEWLSGATSSTTYTLTPFNSSGASVNPSTTVVSISALVLGAQ
jgi:hypothetical protein